MRDVVILIIASFDRHLHPASTAGRPPFHRCRVGARQTSTIDSQSRSQPQRRRAYRRRFVRPFHELSPRFALCNGLEALDADVVQSHEHGRRRFRGASFDLLPAGPKHFAAKQVTWPASHLVGFDRVFAAAQPLQFAPDLTPETDLIHRPHAPENRRFHG
jgi:hypothetical protein